MSAVIKHFTKLFGGWELCDGFDADCCRRGSNSAYTRKARPSWRKKPLRLFVLPFHADVIRSHPPGRSGYETIETAMNGDFEELNPPRN